MDFLFGLVAQEITELRILTGLYMYICVYSNVF